MLKLGIDEFTIIVLLSEKNKNALETHDWDDVACFIVTSIASILSLTDVFGKASINDSNIVKGYNHGFEYGEHAFFFRVCYHSYYPNMGVAIKFSAQAYTFYRTQYMLLYGTEIEPYDILKYLVNELKLCEVRLSRIDFCADFIDEGICVTDICNAFEHGELQMCFSSGKKNPSIMSYYKKGNIVSTIYWGSKTKNITSLLRIYDKKLEQIQNHGVHYDIALSCTSWVRMENEIRGDYAHSLTKQLLLISSKEELCNLIAECLVNKYSILNTPENKPFSTTAMLIACIKNSDYQYSSNNYSDFTIVQSIDYLCNKSGLIPFMYKLKKIDSNLPKVFIRICLECLNRYEPNKDTKSWLRKHQQYYIEHPNDVLKITSFKEDMQNKSTRKEPETCQKKKSQFGKKLV
jgi:hypothetical protein